MERTKALSERTAYIMEMIDEGRQAFADIALCRLVLKIRRAPWKQPSLGQYRKTSIRGSAAAEDGKRLPTSG